MLDKIDKGGEESKLSTIMYHLSYHTYMTKKLPLKWIKLSENIFHECGFSYIYRMVKISRTKIG